MLGRLTAADVPGPVDDTVETPEDYRERLAAGERVQLSIDARVQQALERRPARPRRDARLAELEAMGGAAEARERLHGPIGLVPSARDARTLAVSVLAEVLAVAGLPAAQADEFRGYLAAEHGVRRQPGPAA